MPPVSIRPQVEALTNSDSDLPACDDPIAGRQLFRDQTIRSGIIGNAQQRFGNAHECDAFLIRQSKFLQEGVEERPLVAPSTRPVHQCHRGGHGAMARA
jgi:hypothetical protein